MINQQYTENTLHAHVISSHRLQQNSRFHGDMSFVSFVFKRQILASRMSTDLHTCMIMPRFL